MAFVFFSSSLPKLKLFSIFQEIHIFPTFPKTLEEREKGSVFPNPTPQPFLATSLSPCLAPTLSQVREGSGLPPMARHTSLTRVPALRRCPSGGPSIHNFWAGSVRKARRVAFLSALGLRVGGRVFKEWGTPEGKGGGSLTFHIQGE